VWLLGAATSSADRRTALRHYYPLLWRRSGNFTDREIQGVAGPKQSNIPEREFLLDFYASRATLFPFGKTMATIQDIGQIVRDARKSMGLRQEALAAAAGVGVRFLVELERGKPSVRLDKMLAVLDALGLELEVKPRGGAVRPIEL
jgi:y4mF family transcriptional regulator